MLDQIVAIWESYGGVYMEGLVGTIVLTLLTIVGASILGVVIALMRWSQVILFALFARFYLWLLRGTPILLQLYFFWLFLPDLIPFELTDQQTILIALIINASAYIAEIVRGGINAVPSGQVEAAKSLGLSKRNIFGRIVFPQAIKNSLPAMGNQYVSILKQTSLASVFFVAELTTSYKTVQTATFLPIPALAISGLIYLALTAIFNQGFGFVERRLAVYDR